MSPATASSASTTDIPVTARAPASTEAARLGPQTSDEMLLDLLHRQGPKSVAEISTAMAVTATAVRQRLVRLTAQGLIAREATPAGRGRPSHAYSITEAGRRRFGSNFGDLALALWQEVRSIREPAIRRGLLERIAGILERMYAGRVEGATLAAKMESLQRLFAERRVAVNVESSGSLPVLTVVDCPYPELAEMDRGICAVERMLFSKVLSQPLRLSTCRLDGHACCQFETN